MSAKAVHITKADIEHDTWQRIQNCALRGARRPPQYTLPEFARLIGVDLQEVMIAVRSDAPFGRFVTGTFLERTMYAPRYVRYPLPELKKWWRTHQRGEKSCSD